MFFFGFLSTTVPYIIIACLYAVGFGLYSGNKLKDKLWHEEKACISELTLTNSESQQLTIQQNYFFKQKQTHKIIVKAFNLDSYKVFHDKALPNFWNNHSDSFYFNCVAATLFTRPPPKII